MDVQFYGANCLVFSNRDIRVVVDDTLAGMGAKNVAKAGDLLLYTGPHDEPQVEARMVIDMPGEYEIANLSITGIAAQAHVDEASSGKQATIYVLKQSDVTYLVTGHVFPNLTEDQLESIGIVDVMFVPVGGNGYTLDPVGALKVIRAVEPKLVIPTHYADKALQFPVPQQELPTALKELGMEPKETTAKLRIKPGDLSDVTQLMVLEKSA